MDPSALIFVALAVAWAAYLIPKALEHHEESARSRSIDKFSGRMRILARREPVGRRASALVTVADRAVEPDPEPVLTEQEYAVLARAYARASVAAARRRRRILDLLLLASVVVAATVIGGFLAWVWLAVPAGLVLAWLVVCRLSVRGQRRRRPMRPVGVPVASDADVTSEPAVQVEPVELVEVLDETGAVQVVPAAEAEVAGWDPLPIMVPTYVVKEQVRRSVRTIELDSTGVWSSGRSDIDSALVRDSDAAAKTARQEGQDDQDERAVGS